MGRYRITRRIEATPEKVFRAFTNPVLVADWMDASGVRDATGPLDMPGTRFTLVIRGPHRFETEVVRAEPAKLHETAGRSPFGSYRMVATLSARDGGTDLDLLTEYTLPLGPIGRWVDRRWIDCEPHTIANREVDRLVALVTDPTLLRRDNGAIGEASAHLDALVEQAQAALLDREVTGWSSRRLRWSGGERRSAN